MGSVCIFFYQMLVEHMQIRSYRCELRRYCCKSLFLQGGNYLLKIFTLQTFVLHRFQSRKFSGDLPQTPLGAFTDSNPLIQSSEIPNLCLAAKIGHFWHTPCFFVILFLLAPCLVGVVHRSMDPNFLKKCHLSSNGILTNIIQNQIWDLD